MMKHQKLITLLSALTLFTTTSAAIITTTDVASAKVVHHKKKKVVKHRKKATRKKKRAAKPQPLPTKINKKHKGYYKVKQPGDRSQRVNANHLTKKQLNELRAYSNLLLTGHKSDNNDKEWNKACDKYFNWRKKHKSLGNKINQQYLSQYGRNHWGFGSAVPAEYIFTTKNQINPKKTTMLQLKALIYNGINNMLYSSKDKQYYRNILTAYSTPYFNIQPQINGKLQMIWVMYVGIIAG